jgi:hypothetical protein
MDLEFERLRQFYAKMSDEELQQLEDESDQLTDVAMDALEVELSHRGLLDRHTEPPPGPGSLEFSKLVTLRQFRDLQEAWLAQGALQSAGIEAHLADDNMVRTDWFISNLIGGVKLKVRPEDLVDASRVLSEPIPSHFEVEGVGKFDQPRCPECNSLDISFEDIDKGVALTSMYFLHVPVAIRNDRWRCFSCGAEWQDPHLAS